MIRGFYRSAKAWYAHSLPAFSGSEVMFGIYDEDGKGCIAEMSVRWYDLGGKLSPKLECFDDSWAVLATFEDLIKELGRQNAKDISEDTFAEILLKLGFKDLTQYANPEQPPPVCPNCGQIVK